MSFVKNLTDKFKAKNLSDSSIQLYLNNLKKLNDNQNVKNFSFLKNVPSIKYKLDQYKPNTQRGILISIVSSLNHAGPAYKKLLKEYYDWMISLNNELKTESKKNIKSETQKKNWMEYEDVMEVYHKLKNDVDLFKDKPKKKISEKEYQKLLDYMVLSLYILIPPRRNKDFMNMNLIRGQKLDTLPKEVNYLDLDNKLFIFNDFKTKKKIGQQKLEIPDNLFDVIQIYLKFYPTKILKKIYAPFLVNHIGAPLTHINSITKILNKIFDKKIGSSLLRHIYLSHRYSDVVDEMNSDAKQMAHGTQTQKDYIKN